MRLPAALRQWVAEHSDALSEETIAEVHEIADALASSSLDDRLATEPGGGALNRALIEIFPGAQAKRASMLIRVVREWANRLPTTETSGPETETVTPESVGPETVELEPAVQPDEPVADEPVADEPVADEPVASEPVASEREAPEPEVAIVAPLAELELIAPSESSSTATPTPTTPPRQSTTARSRAPFTATPLAPATTPRTPAQRARADAADDEPIQAPAFLRSDKVDEEDDVRLYGPRRPWKAVLGSLMGLAVLGGVGFAAWYWYDQREPQSETAVVDAAPTVQPDAGDPFSADPDAAPTADETPETSGDPDAAETVPADDSGAEPSTEPELAAAAPLYWADVNPILNSGTAEITASTYAVSPANRAVLTGHTAAITGIAVSDDGRVLTSGADRRLVDWGADVTLASPDVLNVTAPLTVLTRTADQRVVAGDSDGTVTIINLIEEAEPVVLSVHDVAVSAIDELVDGRLAVASVDGDVAVLSIESPADRFTLPHGIEVTAVVGLADNTIATAAVDGIVRLWASDGQGEPGQIATLNSPVTAMTLLSDGQLATASVNGAIHVVPAIDGASQPLVFPGHIGAVRSLVEAELPDGTIALVSGGDDTTVRLWDVVTGDELLVLEGHGDIISALATLPDGRLVSTSGDGTGRVWDLSIPQGQLVVPPHDWNLSALHPWSNDQFITGGIDGKVVLASTSDTTGPVLISQHDAPIVGISTLQSGDVVSLDAASVLRVSEAVDNPSSSADFTVNIAAGATALDVRPNEGVVTGHADGTVRFYDFESETATIQAHGDGVNDVLALSSGLVVSAGQDMLVRVIDLENPDTVMVFDLHTAPVDALVELPDGRVASAGTDGIYIWSVEGLTQDHVRLNGQRSRTISLVPMPNDQLISTGADGRVRLWDLTSPEAEPVTLVDIPGIVNPHLIQADNGLFVAGAARGYVVFNLS